MYQKWLDRWDERRAQRGEEHKKRTRFEVGCNHVFSPLEDDDNLAEFCRQADQAVYDPEFFREPDQADLNYVWDDGWIHFQSCISTPVDGNNTVWAKVTSHRPSNHALVVFHHWNATKRYMQIAKLLARRGMAVVQIALPYHLERRRPGALYADDMLSPNLGRTLQSMRQAVLDGRKLIRILKNNSYTEISVLGISLGSWVAGLVSAHDRTVRKVLLLLTADSLADMVWTGRATPHIRLTLEDHIDLADLQSAWAPLNLENYIEMFTRSNLNIQVILAKRDTVVLPALSKRFVTKLQRANAATCVLDLNCGHYSISLPPHVLWAGHRISRFLTH